MKRAEKAVSENSNVNQNILNIITPVGLEFTKTSAMVSDNYTKYVIVTNYPSKPEYGWLNKITAIEGVIGDIIFEPTESASLIQRSNDQIKQIRGEISASKDESTRMQKEKESLDIRNMIERVHINGETVGYLTVMLMIQASSKEKLDDRFKKVNGIVTAFGGAIRTLTKHQRDAYLAMAPYGVPNRALQDIGERSMPCSTFVGGFVNASGGINDGTGYLIGRSVGGKPVIINTWLREGDRTNSNWFISGKPGMGKSATIKLLAIMEYALGVKLIFLDPEREYITLTKNLGGRIINCGGGRGGRINPLQVRPVPKLEEEDLTEEDLYDENGVKETYYQDQGYGVSDLALHIQTLRTFHKLYKKDLRDLELSRLEKLLIRMYEKKGITWNTDVSKLKPNEFPIYTDLYAEITEEMKKNPNDNVLINLESYFFSIAEGADARIFNGYTDINFDTEVINLDISSLLEGDESVLKAQFHNINSWVWSIVSRDRNERILYILDEGYLIVDPDNPETIKFVKNFTKRSRKYESGLMFITHAVSDVLEPEVKRHGQAIIDTACYKFIMGTDAKNLQETKDLFKLTDAETRFLESQEKTKGLLFAGAKRAIVQIKITDYFLNLMGKAGGR